MAKHLAPTILSILFLLLQNHTPLTTAADSDIYGPSTAFTSRYWDCCKPSCAWTDKASFVDNRPVQSCDVDQNPISDFGAGTGCNEGPAFSCANQSPWAVNDTFSYGFVGAFLLGGQENHWCCSCYELEFLDGDVKGQRMVVQASNTDYEMSDQNIFTFGIPAGNTSYAGACAIQYDVDNSIFGQENVGISSRSQCDDLPQSLRDGCYWRFDWFKDALKPNITYKRTRCPSVLTDISQCTRTDEETFETAANNTSGASSSTTPLPFSSLSILLFSTTIVGLLGSWILII